MKDTIEKFEKFRETLLSKAQHALNTGYYLPQNTITDLISLSNHIEYLKEKAIVNNA